MEGLCGKSSKLSDSQLRQFLMAELEKFHSKGMRKKKAACNTGKQRDSNVYVFNSSLQVYDINNNNNNNNKCLYFTRSNT